MSDRQARISGQAVWLLGCLVFGALASVVLGQDASWDLKNYHLYNPWAWLQGRTNDVAAASLQSYFNPLPDVPYLLLSLGPMSHAPRVLAAWQGLGYGALLFLVFLLARQLASLQHRRFGAADVCAVLFGATGTMAISQLGSTTHEITLAAMMLTAVSLLLPLCRPQLPGRWLVRVVCAGLCAGLAAGLKPTAVIYCPGLVLAVLAALGPSRKQAWLAACMLGISLLMGFAITYGWWGWQLYQLTGNPVFPLFNHIFKSDLLPAVVATDIRFKPRTLMQWLFYPFFWLSRDNTAVVTEFNMADPRYALAMLSLVVLGVIGWLGRKDDRSAQARAALRLIVTFVAVSYVLWLAMFSILRYAVAIEALTGLIVLAAVHAVMRQRTLLNSNENRRPALIMGVLLLAAIAGSIYPHWGRTGYGESAFAVDAGPLEPGSQIVLAGQPSAYLAPLITGADDLEYVGISWLTALADQHGLGLVTRERLRDHVGPAYIVFRDDAQAELAWLQRAFPSAAWDGCHPIRSSLEFNRHGRDHSQGLEICRLNLAHPIE